MKWPLACDPEVRGRRGSLRGTVGIRDQIRDQDATGRSGTAGDGCDVDGVASTTKGDGGDGSGGLGPGSLCS